MNKKIKWIGILGVISFISYFLAVIISPSAYPGYNWLERAVSDLSADDAPSKKLWNMIASPYVLCGVSFLTVLSLTLPKNINKCLRYGIITFTIMNWISAIGYGFFPLTTSDGGNTFQDAMHMIITGIVVLASIVSLILIIVGGFRKKANPALGIVAAITLFLMTSSALSLVVPHSIFGLIERFSTISATGFTAALGIFTLLGCFNYQEDYKDNSKIQTNDKSIISVR